MEAYRDAAARCPRCVDPLESRGEAAGCRACGGLWLPEPRLEEMLREMHHDAAAPVFAVRFGAAPIACPACEAPMEAVTLQGVEVDRCLHGHGVWFDARELEAALRAAADAAPEDEVPDVRVGLGRGILGAFGALLEILGWATVGAVKVGITGEGGRRGGPRHRPLR